MLRKLTLLPALLIAAGLSAQTPVKTPAAPPFQMDKPKVEAYLRHLFVWPAAIQMTLSDPVPSDVPGLYQFRMRASQGEASQEEEFYISSDGQKIIRGTAFELAKKSIQGRTGQVEDRSAAQLRYARRAGGAGGVQRFRMSRLQRRSQDAARQPDERLPQTSALLFRRVSARITASLGQGGGDCRAAASSTRTPPPSGIITTGFSRTRKRSRRTI